MVRLPTLPLTVLLLFFREHHFGCGLRLRTWSGGTGLIAITFVMLDKTTGVFTSTGMYPR